MNTEYGIQDQPQSSHDRSNVAVYICLNCLYNALFFKEQAVKISKRLAMIDKMVASTHHHIWDCCCDHGHLGMTLLERQAAQHIHFVDIVPSITKNLAQRLNQRFCAEQDQWQIHTLDALDIPIDQYSVEQRHLIIIAGLGGEQSLQLVQGLIEKYPNNDLQFLLCPLRHHYTLRLGLAKLSLSLVAEQLLKEQKWYYEIIHLTNYVNAVGCERIAKNPIIATGSLLWSEPNALHQEYLMQIMQHYQRVLRSLDASSEQHRLTQTMLTQYGQVLEGIN